MSIRAPAFVLTRARFVMHIIKAFHANANKYNGHLSSDKKKRHWMQEERMNEFEANTFLLSISTFWFDRVRPMDNLKEAFRKTIANNEAERTKRSLIVSCETNHWFKPSQMENSASTVIQWLATALAGRSNKKGQEKERATRPSTHNTAHYLVASVYRPSFSVALSLSIIGSNVPFDFS